MENKKLKEDNGSAFASEITDNLLANFTPETQRNVLSMIEANIQNYYECNLKGAKDNLENVIAQYSTFKGKVDIAKETHFQ